MLLLLLMLLSMPVFTRICVLLLILLTRMTKGIARRESQRILTTYALSKIR